METGLKKSISSKLQTIMGNLQSKPRPSHSESSRTTNTLTFLDDYLPQPDEDRKISANAKRLQIFIDSHSSWYHSRPVPQSREEILALLQNKLFKSNPEEMQRMAYSLHDTALRMVTLRILIAKVIFMGIDFYGNPETTLLPPGIVSIMSAFQSNTTRSKEGTQVDQIARCEWRRIGSFLLAGPTNKPREMQDSKARIDKLATSLDSILYIFAEDPRGKENENRLHELRALLKTGADFGLLLFAQPCVWEMDWSIRPLGEAPDTTKHTTKPQQSSQGSLQRPNLANGRQESERGEQQQRQNLQRFQGNQGNQGKISVLDRPRSMAENEIYEAHRSKDHSRRNSTQLGRRSSVRSQHPDAPHGTNRTKWYHESTPKGQFDSDDSTPSKVSNQGYGKDYKTKPRHDDVGRPTLHPDEDFDPDAVSHDYAQPDPSKKDLQPAIRQDSKLSQSDATHIGGSTKAGLDAWDQRVPAEPRVPTKRPLPVIYFPALLKTTDDYGRELRRSIIVSEPEVDKGVVTPWY